MKSCVNQWEKSPQTSGVEDTHLVRTHSEVPTCPQTPAFCVADSAGSASSSGWGMSLSDLNSPKGRKLRTTIPKSAGRLLNLHTGIHPATWKSVMSSHSPDWRPAEQREGGTCTVYRWTGDFPLCCCQANAFHQHPISARNALKEGKKIFGAESFCVPFQSTKGPLALRRASLGLTQYNKL